jgi:hypothetical protein
MTKRRSLPKATRHRVSWSAGGGLGGRVGSYHSPSPSSRRQGWRPNLCCSGAPGGIRARFTNHRDRGRGRPCCGPPGCLRPGCSDLAWSSEARMSGQVGDHGGADESSVQRLIARVVMGLLQVTVQPIFRAGGPIEPRPRRAACSSRLTPAPRGVEFEQPYSAPFPASQSRCAPHRQPTARSSANTATATSSARRNASGVTGHLAPACAAHPRCVRPRARGRYSSEADTSELVHSGSLASGVSRAQETSIGSS